MDQTLTSNNADSWALSRLGYAIDVFVDRRLNNPQVITDHSAAYGMDANGNLYEVGQPTTVQQVSPLGGQGGSSLLLLVLALAFMASRHGK